MPIQLEEANTVPVENLNLVPSICIWFLAPTFGGSQLAVCNSSFRGSEVSGLHEHLHTCAHTHLWIHNWKNINQKGKRRREEKLGGWCMPLILASSPQEAEAGGPLSLSLVYMASSRPDPVSIKKKKRCNSVCFRIFTEFYKILLPNSRRCSSIPKGALDLGSPYLFVLCSQFWQVLSAFCQWMINNLAFYDWPT